MKVNSFLLLVIGSLIALSSCKSRDYEKHSELPLLFYKAQRSGPLPKNSRIYWRHNRMKFNFSGAGALTLIAWSDIDFKKGYKKAGQYQYQYMLDMVKWITDYFLKWPPEKRKRRLIYPSRQW